jgi:hypothetical protein
MKTIFGLKSLQAIEKQESVGGADDQRCCYFFPMKGFLGTGAAFGADLDLVVQLIMGAALIAGACLAKQRHYKSRNLPNDRASFELVNDRCLSCGRRSRNR